MTRRPNATQPSPCAVAAGGKRGHRSRGQGIPTRLASGPKYGRLIPVPTGLVCSFRVGGMPLLSCVWLRLNTRASAPLRAPRRPRRRPRRPRRPRADPCVSPGASGQVFRRRGRRWRARRPTCRRTRLPYESRPSRAAVAGGRQRLSKQFGWPMLASMSVRVGSINPRGRPRPGGQEPRAVAKRGCWAGLRHQTEPPGCATTDAEPGSSCRRGGGFAYTQFPAVPLAGAIGAAVPEHAPPLRVFGRLPRCEPGVSRRPHTRELLCTPASSGAWSHAPRRAEPAGRVACRCGV
jgi:hypothetical protein